MLFALPLLPGDSEIVLTSPAQSKGYIALTLHALAQFEITVEETPDGWRIPGGEALPLHYDAVVSAASRPISEQVLTVIFVLEWAGA